VAAQARERVGRMTIQDWLIHRARIWDAATLGEWWRETGTRYIRDQYGSLLAEAGPTNCNFMVDAHRYVPVMMRMIEAAIEASPSDNEGKIPVVEILQGVLDDELKPWEKL